MKKLILVLAASALLLAGCEGGGSTEPNNNPYSRSAKKTTENVNNETKEKSKAQEKEKEKKKTEEVQKTTPEANAQVTELAPVTAPDMELPVQGAQHNEQGSQTEENSALQEQYENQTANDEVIELPVIPID